MKPLTPEQIAASRKAWKAENEPLGLALGYPQCCVDAFCDDSPEVLAQRELTQDDRDRYEAGRICGRFTGFIPCAQCAKDVLAGRKDLATLIKGRNPLYAPFPYHANPDLVRVQHASAHLFPLDPTTAHQFQIVPDEKVSIEMQVRKAPIWPLYLMLVSPFILLIYGCFMVMGEVSRVSFNYMAFAMALLDLMLFWVIVRNDRRTREI